jgi:hypothetical protein
MVTTSIHHSGGCFVLGVPDKDAIIELEQTACAYLEVVHGSIDQTHVQESLILPRSGCRVDEYEQRYR